MTLDEIFKTHKLGVTKVRFSEWGDTSYDSFLPLVRDDDRYIGKYGRDGAVGCYSATSVGWRVIEEPKNQLRERSMRLDLNINLI